MNASRKRLIGLGVALALLAPWPAQAQTTTEDRCTPDPVGLALEASGVAEFTEDVAATGWQRWFVAAGEVSVPQPPATLSVDGVRELAELKQLTLGRTDDEERTVARWDTGGAAHEWTEVFLGIIKASSARADKSPPRISRDIAIVHTALFDALAATWDAKYCYRRPAPGLVDPALSTYGKVRYAPSYPSEHATVAGVMKVLMPALYGVDVDGEVTEAVHSRLVGGLNYPSDVEAGLAIGTDVAQRVLEARTGDGSDATWDGSGRITGTCNWEPTPPAFAYPPAEPVWGNVRPWVLEGGDQFRPEPPPACDSPEYLAAAEDVYHASLQLTDRQKEIALYWAGGPGTETPPGMNLRTALESSARHRLSTMREAHVLAHVGATLADAAISAWDTKYAYWWDRPVTTIRRLHDPSWTSFIGTPPFPGYTSGHSTFSGSAMHVLAWYFPDDAVAFRSMATEAAMSRFYGGIHARYDNEVGLTAGEHVGNVAIERAARDMG